MGLFQSLKQHKTGPIFFSLSLYQCFILYRLTHTINLCQQNASAGLWDWCDRLGRESHCFVNAWPFRSPLELTKGEGGFLWSFLRFAIEAASLNSSGKTPFHPLKPCEEGESGSCFMSSRSLLHSEPLCRPSTTDSVPRPCWLFHLLGLPFAKSCDSW